MRLHDLKGAVARDDYVVDPQAVAEAMLRRGRGAIASAIRAPHEVSGGRTPARHARRSGPQAGPERYRR
jgi:hypothetical protein